ncbi:hypothetical protein TB2_018022 [Malus domestica]
MSIYGTQWEITLAPWANVTAKAVEVQPSFGFWNKDFAGLLPWYWRLSRRNRVLRDLLEVHEASKTCSYDNSEPSLEPSAFHFIYEEYLSISTLLFYVKILYQFSLSE